MSLTFARSLAHPPQVLRLAGRRREPFAGVLDALAWITVGDFDGDS